MKKYPFSLLLFIPILIWSQPVIEWQHHIGGSVHEDVESVLQTPDGGYFSLGFALSADGDVVGNYGSIDFWGVKIDSNGAIVWKKTYGGSDTDWPAKVSLTSDGGFIMAGFTESNDSNVSGNHGQRDIWVVKTDAEGNIIWQKCLGGSKDDEATDIQQTTDGGYIVSGSTNSVDGDFIHNNGYFDYCLIKLDANGNLEWQKVYGGSNVDYSRSVVQTSDGGYIACGFASSDDGDLNGNIIGQDIWIIKLDNQGSIEWQREYGGTNPEYGLNICQSKDGGYVFAGSTWSVDGDITINYGMSDMWVVKLDPTGQIQWQRTVGGAGQEIARDIAELADGGYVSIGLFTSNEATGYHGGGDLWVTRLSESGEVLWQQYFGGSQTDDGNSIQPTSDGGFIAGGHTRSSHGDGDVQGPALGASDFWILKLAPETSDAIEPVHPLLQIYPNPANTHIRVQGIDTQQDGQVIISDALGRIVMTRPLQTAASLELESLPPGMYFLLARYADGKQMNGKFQKVE